MNDNQPANPYQAPEAPVYNGSDSRARELVSGWRRLGTYLIDTLCYYVIFIGISIALTFLMGEGWLQLLEGVGGNLIALGLFVIYYLGFELAFARTPGKFVLGTIVIDEKGNKPTAGQMIGRSFARLIPFEAFSCIGGQSRGWHDSLAKTYVVRAT